MLGKTLCPRHGRWVRFQSTYRPCPECGIRSTDDPAIQTFTYGPFVLGEGYVDTPAHYVDTPAHQSDGL